jgi:hypothetical protein
MKFIIALLLCELGGDYESSVRYDDDDVVPRGA